MASFQAPNGSLIFAPDQYDPKTGENLTYQQVTNKAPELKPVKQMVDPSNPKQTILAPLDKIEDASQMGLIPREQFEAQQSAKASKENLLAGNIPGYEAGKAETLASQFAQGTTQQFLPEIQGAISSVLPKSLGGTTNYEEGKEIAQAVNAAQRQQHPILSTAGNIAGEIASTAAPASKIGVGLKAGQVAKSAGLVAGSGALSTAGEDISSEQTDTLGSDVAKSAGINAALGAGGQALGSAGKALYNYAADSISPAVKAAFIQGTKGVSADQLQAARTASATYSDTIKDNLEGVRQELGAQHGAILKGLDGIGGVDYQPIKDSVSNAINSIDDKISKTSIDQELLPYNNAKKLLTQVGQTLDKNDGSARALNNIKQQLGEIIYPKDQTITPFNRNSMNAIEDVRSSIQHHLEGYSPDLRQTNIGYKDVHDALDAKGMDDLIPSPSEMESLGSQTPSANSIRKLENLKSFINDINDNPSISNNLKFNLNSMLSDMQNVATQAKIGQQIESKHGLTPFTSPTLANKAGLYTPSRAFTRGGGYALQNLPPSLQQIIQAGGAQGSALHDILMRPRNDQQNQ